MASAPSRAAKKMTAAERTARLEEKVEQLTEMLMPGADGSKEDGTPKPPSDVVVQTKQDGFYFIAESFEEACDIYRAATDREDPLCIFLVASSEGREVALVREQITRFIDIRPTEEAEADE